MCQINKLVLIKHNNFKVFLIYELSYSAVRDLQSQTNRLYMNSFGLQIRKSRGRNGRNDSDEKYKTI